MTERPALSRETDSATFRSYYYLKEELVDFCRQNGIPTSGGKIEITERIARFLDTFQKWLKGNAGKTYEDAIRCWKYKKQRTAWRRVVRYVFWHRLYSRKYALTNKCSCTKITVV